MRVWAELYDTSGNKLNGGTITAIKSASVSDQLDSAGSWKLELALDERALTLLAVDTEIRIYVQQVEDEPGQEWTRGLIRDRQLADSEGGIRLSIGGPDMLDELTEITTGIGRSYTNQLLSAIAASLVGLVSGWSVTVDATGGQLQTARFDGVHVLAAIGRVAKEAGIHYRRGSAAQTLEMGAFGTLATTARGELMRAIKPPSEMNYELLNNEAVILIDQITQTSTSNDVVNWCIPIGAGEGSAALTLKDTTFAIYNANGTLWRAGATSRYPIYRRVNGNGIAEFYIDARASASDRVRQAMPTFKEIGAVSNSTAAKQLAANMLALAAMAYLDRQRVVLATYKLSAKHVKVDIRPGDKLFVTYAGRIEIADETRSSQPRLTYLDVNEPLWVLKTTKKIAADSIDYDFEVATVDRYALDSSRIIVSMMEALNVKNVTVQTTVAPYNYVYTDTLGWNAIPKPARFYLDFADEVLDVLKVTISFKTFPLDATTVVADLTPFQYNWALKESYNYPSDVTLWINGVDVSADFGGPWNAGGTNAALDITDLDISTYIESAGGGFQQTHLVELKCGTRIGEVRYDSSFPSVSQSTASCGYAQMLFRVLAITRGTR